MFVWDKKDTIAAKKEARMAQDRFKRIKYFKHDPHHFDELVTRQNTLTQYLIVPENTLEIKNAKPERKKQPNEVWTSTQKCLLNNKKPYLDTLQRISPS